MLELASSTAESGEKMTSLIRRRDGSGSSAYSREPVVASHTVTVVPAAAAIIVPSGDHLSRCAEPSSSSSCRARAEVAYDERTIAVGVTLLTDDAAAVGRHRQRRPLLTRHRVQQPGRRCVDHVRRGAAVAVTGDVEHGHAVGDAEAVGRHLPGTGVDDADLAAPVAGR